MDVAFFEVPGTPCVFWLLAPYT